MVVVVEHGCGGLWLWLGSIVATVKVVQGCDCRA